MDIEAAALNAEATLPFGCTKRIDPPPSPTRHYPARIFTPDNSRHICEVARLIATSGHLEEEKKVEETPVLTESRLTSDTKRPIPEPTDFYKRARPYGEYKTVTRSFKTSHVTQIYT